MAVMLFETRTLMAQLGHSGLNELYNELARRMRRHTGVINPAGRYYDSCFLVLFQTMHSPRMMRTLSLRVASSLREPVQVTTLSGERLIIRADIGVGMVQVSDAAAEVDDLLHEAQTAAMAARHMLSRAALLDPTSQQPMAIETVKLGSRWKPLQTARKKNAPVRPRPKNRPARANGT